MVARLAKPGSEILKNLDANKAELVHMAIALPSEVGELADTLKKHLIYNQPLDIDNILEELGDLEFFIVRLRQLVNLHRTIVLSHNVNKLNARYASGKYSDTEAKERKDK